MVGDVGGGNGAEVHMGGRLVFSENPKEDTLPGVWSGTHCGFHDGTPPPHARDRSRNRLELNSGKPDSTPTPGLQHEISEEDEPVPLLLPYMPGILLYMERPELSLQHAALGGLYQYPGGSPQTPP